MERVTETYDEIPESGTLTNLDELERRLLEARLRKKMWEGWGNPIAAELWETEIAAIEKRIAELKGSI